LLHRGLDPAIIDFTIDFKILRHTVKHCLFNILWSFVEYGVRIGEHELAVLSEDALEVEHLGMYKYFQGLDQKRVDETKELT
jgi:hypothetical protein